MRVTTTDVHIQAAINMRRASVVDVVKAARDAARPPARREPVSPRDSTLPTGAA